MLEGKSNHMKRMNGTVTLSFVEEDNKQRVIFRVVPLCTAEGTLFRDAAETFPDQGSLRVVPDKREQSTFKERMREMGSLCVIELLHHEGKELVKVRQNRNYDPAQGELNQFAIYSDVVQEFAPDGVFEVLEWNGTPLEAPASLTASVLLLSNKVLYGPVPCGELENASPETLKPFGNDRFLLHTVDFPNGSAHTLYWNPEAIINWRQRRGNLRKKNEKFLRNPKETDLDGEALEVSSFSAPSEAEAPVSEPILFAAPIPEVSQAETLPAETSPSPAAPDKETALPIGTRLDILDTSVPFEEHISRLDQPLSESANRLSAEPVQEKVETESAPLRFSGTPLVRNVAHMPKPISRPSNLQHVVERQMRQMQEDGNLSELQVERSYPMENPIENLLSAVDIVWEDKELRTQAIPALLENPGFLDSLLQVLRSKGQDVHAIAAAHAQLADIEAERLSLTMEIEKAKSAKKRYQETALAEAAQKKLENLHQLTREVDVLSQKKEDLLALLGEINGQTTEQALHFISPQLSSLGGIDSQRLTLLSPSVGTHRSMAEMLESVRSRLCACGFAITEDEALLLLLSFSLFSSICLQGTDLMAAQLFAQVFLDALGLENESAVLSESSRVQIINLLGEDGFRSPTATIQSLGTDALSLNGHKTLFLATEAQANSESFPCFPPVVRVPPISAARSGKAAETAENLPPVSLSSLQALTSDIQPLLEEGEKWFEELRIHLATQELPISDALLLSMRRFVATCSPKIRGGFLAAADAAVCQWLVPLLISHHISAERMQPLLHSFPRTLEALEK